MVRVPGHWSGHKRANVNDNRYGMTQGRSVAYNIGSGALECAGAMLVNRQTDRPVSRLCLAIRIFSLHADSDTFDITIKLVDLTGEYTFAR